MTQARDHIPDSLPPKELCKDDQEEIIPKGFKETTPLSQEKSQWEG